MDDRSSSLFDRIFELTIAFELPGLVPLFAYSASNDTVRRWFAGDAGGPAWAGLAFVMLSALAVGFVLTAIRFVLFEQLSLPRKNCFVGPRLAFDERQRKEHAAEYFDLRHQHYYHYLAMANLSVAIPIAAVIWKVGQTTQPGWWTFSGQTGLVLLVAAILAVAARDACRRYDQRRAELLRAA